MSKPRITLFLFIIAWLVIGIIAFFTSGCGYSQMPMREVTETYRFYNFKIKKTEMLVVFLLAKHDQDLTWIKSNDDYDIIFVDKTYRVRGGGGRLQTVKDEALKVYLKPKQSFLLNWTYLTDEGYKNVLYTKIEVE